MSIERESAEVQKWQEELTQALIEPVQLLEFLGIEEISIDLNLKPAFSTRVPLSYAKKIKYGDISDPLLTQVLPLEEENRDRFGYCENPVGDQEAVVDKSVIKKYKGRALIITTDACPLHCRYCFRQHFPYDSHRNFNSMIDSINTCIAKDRTCVEAILSGGDPFSLSDHKLLRVIRVLNHIEHLHTIRIHTRFPTVIPSRITKGLLSILKQINKRLLIVLHVNHPAELCDRTFKALADLKKVGVSLLNQSVLLKGVNDDANVLQELSHALWKQGVLPYYLHQLDRVKGAARFEVDDRRAKTLIHALQKELPGYLVPKLVREVAGKTYKVPL